MLLSFIKPVVDVSVTLMLWTYYILCYLLFFNPFYLFAFFFSADRAKAFQKLNCILYRSFFALVRTIVPGLTININSDVFSIRSSVVIANHLSFLDSILFVSLFEKHKTIVKKSFFNVPIFGWILKTSGYIAPVSSSMFADDMMLQIKNLQAHLAAGGNLFVFPEGTRSRTGDIGPFEKGAFSIAKLCRTPIRIVKITNTHKLYPPDSFLFNTCVPNIIEVKLVGSIEPDYENSTIPLSKIIKEARVLLEGKSKH